MSSPNLDDQLEAAASGMKPPPLSVQCREVQFPIISGYITIITLVIGVTCQLMGFTYGLLMGFKSLQIPWLKPFFPASTALHGSSSDRVPTS